MPLLVLCCLSLKKFVKLSKLHLRSFCLELVFYPNKSWELVPLSEKRRINWWQSGDYGKDDIGGIRRT